MDVLSARFWRDASARSPSVNGTSPSKASESQSVEKWGQELKPAPPPPPSGSAPPPSESRSRAETEPLMRVSNSVPDLRPAGKASRTYTVSEDWMSSDRLLSARVEQFTEP